MSEDRWLAEALAALPAEAQVLLGPGDDAAVLATPGGAMVVATDALIDGVHFRLEACGGRAAARKALAVNLSDLAAMGAEPAGLLVAAVLPRPVDRALFDELMAGFREAAARYACPLLGGDTNAADSPLTLAVTVLGRVGPGGVVRRSGGRVGDTLSVTGPLGGSGRGRHLTFEPRLAAGAVLARDGIAHAMMDLSDGLSRDLPRLCEASGVGATLDAARIPRHADTEGVLERALHDGEDFELLVAHGPLDDAARAALAQAGVELTSIGMLEAEAGVRLRTADGVHALQAGGFDHLAG